MRQGIITKFIMYFDDEFDLENYYGRMLTSRERTFVNKQTCSIQYASSGIRYKF